MIKRSIDFAGYKFDSKIELDVYKQLALALGKKEVIVHQQNRALSPTMLLIKPESKHFPAIYWNVDFYLPSFDRYIEVKGGLDTADFESMMLKLKFLDYMNPELAEKIIIINSDFQSQRKGAIREIWKNRTTIPFSQIHNLIKDLKLLRTSNPVI